jgi:SurA-like N-terminal domain
MRLAAFGAACFGACAVLAACSPVKTGAAAIVGDERITTSSLDTQVSNLQAAAKPYGSQVQLTPAQMPNAVLSWLIRFDIADSAAASAGISVTEAQIQQGVATINSQAAMVAKQQGFSSPQAVLLTAGISPQMLPALGRYQAELTEYAKQVNGGTLPSSTAEDNTVNAALTKAQCSAAKSLNIQVNPQFGRLDYTQYSVVATPDRLSRPAGTPSPASTTGLYPAC